MYTNPLRGLALHLIVTAFIFALAINTTDVEANTPTFTLQSTTTPQSCRTGTGALNSIMISPDGQSVLTNWHPGEARLWDIKTGTVIRTFFSETRNHYDTTNVAISPDGNLIAIDIPLKATVWNAHTGELLHTFPRNYEDIETHITFSQDSHYLMMSGTDGASLWDVKSGQKTFSFPGFQQISRNQRAYISSDGKYVLVADETKAEINLWDAKTGQKVHTFPSAFNATFTPDAKGILTRGGYNNNYELVLWDIQTFQQLQNFGRFDAPEWKISSDSKYLLVRAPDYTLWNLQTGELLLKFPFGYLNEFFPDNHRILINAEIETNDKRNHELNIWDIPSQQLVNQLDILNNVEFTVGEMVISPDGQYAFFGDNGELNMWSLETGKKIKTFC